MNEECSTKDHTKKNKYGSKKQIKKHIKRTKRKHKSSKIKKLKSIKPYDLVQMFLLNIDTYIRDNTIRKYFAILGLDPIKLVHETSDEYKIEIKKTAKAFITYPNIVHEIFLYLITKQSKLNFLNKFSIEQIRYITNLELIDTKLHATAGSGKTRSLLGRIKFIVEHGLAKKEEVFAITFSKHAATDFRNKIKELFPDFPNFCELKNLSTIDSLAKSILCKVKSHKSENVEILSIALRNYLKEMPDSEIETIRAIKNVKHLFIDEAQDLNQVQYDIALLFKEKFGTVVELIGDANQNIYQFRRSSSTYLLNFPAKTYELTLNFRSSQEIINFCEGLKPVPSSRSVSGTGRVGEKVVVMTKPAQDIHKMLLYFIKLYGKEKDLSGIAVICPTRGIGAYDSVGLSVIFNLFKINNIPFKQLYNESGFNDEAKRDVEPEPGHINLLTYHGTKGLEFDVVFVMDFYQFLFNIKPTEEEHKIAQYLLYVATSRAISLLFICTYTNTHGGYLNHWITKIRPEFYYSELPPKIPHLSFRDIDRGPMINGITEILIEMSDEQLDMIDNMLVITEDEKIFTRRIYPDYTHIDRGKDETLFGIFCEELFYLQYFLAREKNPKKMALIQIIIDSRFIIVNDDSDFRALKPYIGPNKLCWAEFDLKRNSLPDRICLLIDKYFNREIDLNDCIVCTSEFIKIVDENISDIKKTYDRYLNPISYDYNFKKILIDFFYLVVVEYAYDIKHYYYICNHGKDKEDLLYNGATLFDEINKYASLNYLACDLILKTNVSYDKMMLCGEIDFIEKYPHGQTIVEIKCVKEISIRYYIQLLVYNFCYYYQKKEYDKLFGNKFKIVNLLTGLEHYLLIDITPANMFNLLIIMAETGNLTFDNLNLIYDLETNDGIKTIGPLNYKPTLPRSLFIKNGTRYEGKIFPEIIEIAIKDYDTGMVLLDTLVKAEKPIPKAIQQLTHIKPSMLIGKPHIDSVRGVLRNKMKRFTNCKMISHNGYRFDNGIILYDKLIDPQKVSFLDTLSIIPIHLPGDIKLESKSLGNIYRTIFKKDFNAHRAMNDVDALIKIMRHLKVSLS